MNSNAVAIVGGVFILLVGAYAVPTIMAATEDPQMLETELMVNDEIEVTEGLVMTVTDTTNSEVTVDLVDVETQQNQTLMIDEGTNESYSLPGGNGTVENVQSTNQAAELVITYDPAYGWSPGATVIVDNVGLIFILMLFVVVGGVIVVIQ